MALGCSSPPSTSSTSTTASPSPPASAGAATAQPPAAEQPGAGGEPNSSAAPWEQEEPLSPVVAEVNGQPLYGAFYDQTLDFIRRRLSTSQQSADVERYINARADAFDLLVQDELLYQEAQRQGVTVSQSDFDAEYQNAVRAAGGEGKFFAVMRGQRITRSQTLDGMRKRLTIDKFVKEKVAAGLTAGSEEMLKYYNANLKRFTPEVWIKASDILIRCPKTAPPDVEQSARRRAEKILGNIRAGGSFEEMARQYSEDRTAELGGNIGIIKQGSGPPEFDAVAFAMKAGQVSDVIRTNDGFHIIKVTERRGGEPESFETVQEACRKAVLQQKQADAIDRLVSQLRASAEVISHLE